MRVVLTQRTVVAPTGEVRDCLDQRWGELLGGWGMLVLPLATGVPEVDAHLAALEPDAVVLTGGNDLASILGARDPAPRRDEVERQAIAWCAANEVPLVGVCRGLQLLAEVHGLALERVDGHAGARHDVVLDDGSRREVNSFHDFAVCGDGIPPDLHVLARDEAGHVEALVHRELPQAGVMWHPEREPGPDPWGTQVLLALLTEAARA